LTTRGTIVVDGPTIDTSTRSECDGSKSTVAAFSVERKYYERTAFDGTGTISASLDLHGNRGIAISNHATGQSIRNAEWWQWYAEEPHERGGPFLGDIMNHVAALEVCEPCSAVIGVDNAGRTVATDLRTGKVTSHMLIMPFDGILSDFGKAAIDPSNGYVAYSTSGRTALVDATT